MFVTVKNSDKSTVTILFQNLMIVNNNHKFVKSPLLCHDLMIVTNSHNFKTLPRLGYKIVTV